MNSVFLVGRLGADPEGRQTSTGKTLCVLNVATDRADKDGATVEPDWHRVVVWGRQAETCTRYLEKGRMVAISGRLNHRSWEDEKGQKKYMTEVVAFRVQFFSSGRQDAESGPSKVVSISDQSLPF